ncbi:unnamed protein product [Brachionus calyciflorus]|uniref:MULE transposase domain-containing protein n=1 Tax=Brachionus calyciflorus TaxID=104777 RepID=A0A814A597_9BILA|nr:unnamed protein product [Brachionus calyciflorus]
MDINRPFYFGFNVNDKNIPIQGEGTKSSRVYFYGTTIKLLQMNCNTLDQNGIALFHIDGTYKITKEGYPLLVFGRSYLKRKIYPIVIGITSSEEQDAQSACSAAAREFFPNLTVLMCWFHLKQAVKKHIVLKRYVRQRH